MPFKVEGAQDTASELMKLTGYRLTIPIACWKLIGWTEPMEVIAELLPTGCVRLHKSDEILPRILSKYKAIQESVDSNRLRLLGAMQDRYNQVTFYGGKNRSVELTERVVIHLGVAQDSTVFVEGSKERIEVMSLAYRRDRIDSTKHDIGV